MEGIAFDIAIANRDAKDGPGDRLPGLRLLPAFGHPVDLGSARSWGERFPKRATAFAVEGPAHEVLAENRTLKGGGAAGEEVARQVLPRRKAR